ncbi:MAG: endonuclease domain-containing protein [Deltaproteobacteria bacterium]|nr:endonuclease domain-containing protein [Deltaproteobacteria bacterium]
MDETNNKTEAKDQDLAFERGSGQIKALIYPDSIGFLSILRAYRPLSGQDLGFELTIQKPGKAAEEVVKEMAKQAFFLWPDWYPSSFWASILALNKPFEPHEGLARASIDRSWLAKAFEAVTKKLEFPFFSEMLLELQASQLSLVLYGRISRAILVVPNISYVDGALRSLAKNIEWLARETSLELSVLLPQSLAQRTALESLVYRAQRVDIDLEPFKTIEDQKSPPKKLKDPFSKPDFDGKSLFDQCSIGSEKKIALEGLSQPFHSIIGQPHPHSQLEIKLAQSLLLDKRLKDLFLFNQRLEVRGGYLIVDLFWPLGGLAVEVDGYAYHSGLSAFINDRHRDYLLTLADLTILRLTAWEIDQDAEKAREKIWEIVLFLAQKKGLKLSSRH